MLSAYIAYVRLRYFLLLSVTSSARRLRRRASFTNNQFDGISQTGTATNVANVQHFDAEVTMRLIITLLLFISSSAFAYEATGRIQEVPGQLAFPVLMEVKLQDGDQGLSIACYAYLNQIKRSEKLDACITNATQYSGLIGMNQADLDLGQVMWVPYAGETDLVQAKTENIGREGTNGSIYDIGITHNMEQALDWIHRWQTVITTQDENRRLQQQLDEHRDQALMCFDLNAWGQNIISFMPNWLIELWDEYGHWLLVPLAILLLCIILLLRQLIRRRRRRRSAARPAGSP